MKMDLGDFFAVRFALGFGDKPVYCKSVVFDLFGHIKLIDYLLDIAQVCMVMVMPEFVILSVIRSMIRQNVEFAFGIVRNMLVLMKMFMSVLMEMFVFLSPERDDAGMGACYAAFYGRLENICDIRYPQ